MNTYSSELTQVDAAEKVRSFMQKVYIWMTGGLVLTGVIAFQVANSPELIRFLLTHQGLFFGILLAELGLVAALSFLINRISSPVAAAMFIVYSALNGITLSTIFLLYTAESIGQVFFISAAMFGVMSLYGAITRKDLTAMGSFMFMGLIGIMITMVVNIFLKSAAIDYAISLLGVFIFLGLTAYDTQKLKTMALMSPASAGDKPAIIGALALYLDFINLFLMLLRLLGKRR